MPLVLLSPPFPVADIFFSSIFHHIFTHVSLFPSSRTQNHSETWQSKGSALVKDSLIEAKSPELWMNVNFPFTPILLFILTGQLSFESSRQRISTRSSSQFLITFANIPSITLNGILPILGISKRRILILRNGATVE
jgi:hypothetical protein